MKNKIIVTGASGLVARYIIERLSQVAENEIIAVSSRVANIRQRYLTYKNVQCIENHEIADFSGG